MKSGKVSSTAVVIAAVLICSIAPAFSSALQQQSKSTSVKSNHKNDLPLLTSGSEHLDAEGKYLLSWTVNSEEETITFEVTAATKGYVGFGISPNGAMTGADLLIAGVNEDGSIYSKDYHGVGNTAPVEDAHSDWNVTFGEETETHTTLRFHRLLNTCDDDDFKITDATMRTIWSMGETDDVQYHETNRGTKSVNFFLQGSGDDFNPEEYEKFDVTVTMEMPSQHTTYWCTIQELPVFTDKKHIVAFEPVLDNLDALQHTHHYIFHRCIAPENEDPDEFFGKWVGHPGDFCYDQQNTSFPSAHYCNGNMVYTWTKGGKRMVFPPTVGLPMPEKLGQREYYALEIHYDNPGQLAGKTFKTGGRMYYSSELREEEAGMLLVEQNTRPELTIPPSSEEFVVAGHCSPECTREHLPEEGITVFNNLLHAHLTGRKLKLRHFRGEEELEWIDGDDYYDFDYQQNKPLPQFRKIQKGDQMTVECTYNTMNVAGNKAVLGGLSSYEEMCQAWFFYYPRQSFSTCGSTPETDPFMSLLGVTEYEHKGSEFTGGTGGYNIKKPDNLAGDYLESVSYKVNWTTEFREIFQRERRFGEQKVLCNRGPGGKYAVMANGVIKYPENLNTYVPPNECDRVVTTTTSSDNTPTTTPCENCSSSERNVGLSVLSITIFVFLVSKMFSLSMQ